MTMRVLMSNCVILSELAKNPRRQRHVFSCLICSGPQKINETCCFSRDYIIPSFHRTGITANIGFLFNFYQRELVDSGFQYFVDAFASVCFKEFRNFFRILSSEYGENL